MRVSRVCAHDLDRAASPSECDKQEPMIAALLGLGGAAATLPGTLELSMLTAAGALPPPEPGPATITLKRLAVVVPAHDEEEGIARCVRSLTSCDSPGFPVEVWVVADNCSDGTAARAREAGATVLERHDTERRGKGWALELAFDTLFERFPDLDAVMVVDADSEVDPNFFVACARWFAAGADGVQVRNLASNADASARTALMNVAFMAFCVLRPRGRARLGLSAGISGNGFGLSRRSLEAVPYTARSVVEDLEHHLRLVQAGFKIAFVDDTAVRSDFPVGDQGADTQRARWEGGRMRMLREHAPPLMKQVLGGKPEMLEPLLELLLLPLGTHVSLLGATLAVPFAPTQLYAAGALGVVGAHVAIAMKVGGATSTELKALGRVPAYVLWKAKMLPKVLQAASREQEWVRTARSTEVASK
jgi:cellulose synthase/poly-beta-1,6-N-acetylglucosamine synthase-like glycosyltransferase